MPASTHALQLAERPNPANDGRRDLTQYLTFTVNGTVYALGILAVREIIEYEDLTVVPMMPPWIRGVINLRGAVVPVIDASARFNGSPAAIGKRTCIVIVEKGALQERQTMGVLVDAVRQVVDISPEDVEPAPAFGTKVNTNFVQGMGKIDGKFVVLLDLDRTLATEELESASADGPTARLVSASA